MYTLRYGKIKVKGDRGILKLSRGNKCKTTGYLSKMMLERADSWVIEGDEPFNQTNALCELLTMIRGGERNVEIHLKSHTYDYETLKSISKTDEILDMCTTFTDRSGKRFGGI